MTNEAIDLKDMSLQYTSATSTSNFLDILVLDGTIPANGYYTIKLSGGSNGDNLPFIIDQTGSINMAESNFKLALINETTAITSNDVTLNSIIDFVGVGTANKYLGNGAAPTPSKTTSIKRDEYSGNNDTDYIVCNPIDISYLPQLIKLNAPTITLNESIINWEAIDNASGYDVYNGENKITTSPITTLEYTLNISSVGTHNISIVAVGDYIDYCSSDTSNVVDYIVEPSSSDETYSLISSLDQLTNGTKIIIVAKKDNTYFGMNNTKESSYMNYSSITVSENVISNPDNEVIWIIEIVEEKIYLKTIVNEKTKYLDWGSGNSAKLEDKISDHLIFGEINTTTGSLQIRNGVNEERFLEYNSGSPRFAFYTSDLIKDLYIFVLNSISS